MKFSHKIAVFLGAGLIFQNIMAAPAGAKAVVLPDGIGPAMVSDKLVLYTASGNNNNTAYTQMIPCQYEDEGFFRDGMAPVKKDGKWGFIDKNGAVVIDFIYDDAKSYSEGLSAVKYNGKWGYINTKGEVIIPYKYAGAYSFKDGVACVDMGLREHKYINQQGNFVSQSTFQLASDFSDGLVRVGKEVNGSYTYGFMNTSGKMVIGHKYVVADSFSEGLASVKDVKNMNEYYYNQDKKWGYIDKTGKLVIGYQFDAVTAFENGMAAVKKDGKWGFIDTAGNTVIAFEYEGAYGFDDNLAPVKKDGKWGYIDPSGKMVIACQFDEAWPFLAGYAPVKKDGKWGYTNTSGTIVVPFQYDACGYVREGMGPVYLNEQYGYVSLPVLPKIETQKPAAAVTANTTTTAPVSTASVPATPTTTQTKQSTINLDFNTIGEFTEIDQYVQYLKSVLDPKDAQALTDADKEEIIQYIMDAYYKAGVLTVTAKDNVIDLTGIDIRQYANKMYDMHGYLNEVLDNNKIYSKAPLPYYFVIEVTNIDTSKQMHLRYSRQNMEDMQKIYVVKLNAGGAEFYRIWKSSLDSMVEYSSIKNFQFIADKKR